MFFSDYFKGAFIVFLIFFRKFLYVHLKDGQRIIQTNIVMKQIAKYMEDGSSGREHRPCQFVFW